MKKYTFITLVMLLVSSNLFAYPGELRSFTRSFPVVMDSELNDCMLCHFDDYELNPFGEDYDMSDSDEELANLDSDGDGITNIVELTAGTFPGDAESK